MTEYTLWLALTLAFIAGACAAGAEGDATPTKSAAILQAGGPLKVVGFGDSITGIYYHTGGQRAWPAMLEIALQRLYPSAAIEVINAGISGNTTEAGLARIETDVIAHQPGLVVVMFGMNDVTRVPAEEFAANLRTIVARCREAGAEVVLCTPNSIYAEDAGRPTQRLAEFAEIVRDVGAELDAPVADCFAAYEQLRQRSPSAWKLLMSETIHPNMHGHKLFAEEMAEVISGRPVSVQDVGPIMPAIPHATGLLAAGKPIKVVAMQPAAEPIEAVLRGMYPNAQIEMTLWPTEGASLAEIELWSKSVRGLTPDLVVIAVPREAAAPTEEAFIRSYSWVLNWSLGFGLRTWDCVALMPSVLEPATPTASAREQLAEALTTDLTRRVLAGQDIPWLDRQDGDARPAAELLAEWFAAQE